MLQEPLKGDLTLFLHGILFSRVSHRSFSWENLLCSVCYRHPSKKGPRGSLWSLGWGLIILWSNNHVNPASDTRHFCAPTLAPVYSRDLTEAHMTLIWTILDSDVITCCWNDHCPISSMPPLSSAHIASGKLFVESWSCPGPRDNFYGWSRRICLSAPFQLQFSCFAVASSGWYPIFQLVSPWGLPLTPGSSHLHHPPFPFSMPVTLCYVKPKLHSRLFTVCQWFRYHT